MPAIAVSVRHVQSALASHESAEVFVLMGVCRQAYERTCVCTIRQYVRLGKQRVRRSACPEFVDLSLFVDLCWRVRVFVFPLLVRSCAFQYFLFEV